MNNTCESVKRFKTPLVWNLSLSFVVALDAENEAEAYDIFDRLGNNREFFKFILQNKEQYGLDIDWNFDENCLSELTMVESDED